MTRRNNPGADGYLGLELPVLDQGFVQLADYLGDDVTIVEAARVSYGRCADVEDVAGNTKLINYLMKHDHGTPFEQCALVFNVKAPIFVFREWHRHRTGKLNEISGRYAALPEEYYLPEAYRVQTQSTSNKQGSGVPLPERSAEDFMNWVRDSGDEAFTAYHNALALGVSRELARIVLPVGTYSRMRWQMDLRNVFNFLRLRMAESAQWEIRQYADSIAKITRAAFPIAYQAFEDHVLNTVTISRSEYQSLKEGIAA